MKQEPQSQESLILYFYSLIHNSSSMANGIVVPTATNLAIYHTDSANAALQVSFAWLQVSFGYRCPLPATGVLYLTGVLCLATGVLCLTTGVLCLLLRFPLPD